MGYYDDFAPYVSAAKKREQSEKTAQRLEKNLGRKLHPINIAGRRNIVQTFWGKAWIEHIESLGDYENRLPRGRAYLRSGAVIDLQIERGVIRAKVAGSSLYDCEIYIEPLPKERLEYLRKACIGKITSLASLVQGNLSDEIVHLFCNQTTGLFPREDEIDMDCSCPDWADLCKHLASVLFGVGVLLDEDPTLFFTLRDIDQSAFISEESVTEMVDSLSTDLTPDFLPNELAEIFGIELDTL